MLDQLHDYTLKRKVNITLISIPQCIKINSKWIINLYIRPKIIKFPEENIEKNLYDVGLGKDLLDTTPKA